MLDFGLHENQHVVSKEEYQRTSPRRGLCVEEGVSRMKERSALRKLMNSARYCAENYRPCQKKKGRSGFVNSNNGAIVLISDFKIPLKPIKMNNYEDGISEILIEKCGRVFNANTVDIFQKTGNQGEYRVFFVFAERKQRENTSKSYGKIVVVKS